MEILIKFYKHEKKVACEIHNQSMEIYKKFGKII